MENKVEKNKVNIEPYNIDKYFEIYLKYMKQTFQESHESNERFDSFVGLNGKKYYQRLATWLNKPTSLIVHLKVGDTIIGMLEASIDRNGDGLISTLFINSKYRRKGYAKKLENYALDFFKKITAIKFF